MPHYRFFNILRDVKWKSCSPSYFFSLVIVVYFPSVCLYETNFPDEGRHSIAHSIFKTCVQWRKDHFGLFLNHKHVVKWAKMLIKLIAVDSNQFIRYNCKTKHCLGSQTLSEYISTTVLDNEKLSINEVLDVLIGVGTFTSTSK